MRRLFWIAGTSAIVVLLLVAVLVGLAALNLNRIIEANRSYLVKVASEAVGRPVSVRSIRVTLGWGVGLRLEDVAVADDPAFGSKEPFFQAARVSGRVDLLPLLFGRIEVARLGFRTARIRVIRDAQGRFNFATLGNAAAKGAPTPTTGLPSYAGSLRPVALWSQAGPSGPGRVTSVEVDGLRLSDGEVNYSDALTGMQLTLRKVDLTLTPIDPLRPGNLAMRLALFGNEQNFTVYGRIGPLARAGQIDFVTAPLALGVTAGPLVPDELRRVGGSAQQVLSALSIPDSISLKGSVAGSIGAPSISLESDLTKARVLYGDFFSKPVGTPLKLQLRGGKSTDGFALSDFDLRLANLHATGRDFSLSPGRLAGDFRVERFDLSRCSPLFPPLKNYSVSGFAEGRARAEVQVDKLLVTGALKLEQAAATPRSGLLARLSNVNAEVDFTGTGATLKSAEFNVGKARLTLRGQADSFVPLHAVYTLSSPRINAADVIVGFAPPQNYQARAVAAAGELTVKPQSGVAVTTLLTSGEGRVNDVSYRDLKVQASYQPPVLRVQSLTATAYSGGVDASGFIKLDDHCFEANGRAAGIDLAQLPAPRSGLGGGLRGRLNGQVAVSGRGDDLQRITPTLKGAGRFEVTNGAVPGINPAAALLQGLSATPGLGGLFSQGLVARYPRVFRSPDMLFQSASANFKINGPQISTQDLKVVAPDYVIGGGGWVSLDQRLDIKADVVLSVPFSRDLMQQNQLISVLADPVSQIHVPLVMAGTFSKISIRPDTPSVLRQIRPGAVEDLGKKLFRNLFK